MPSRCVIILANLQGCTVKFPGPIPIGTIVQIDGLTTEAFVAAHVVNCINIHSYAGWLLGLALEEPSNVWGIPAPGDWLEPD